MTEKTAKVHCEGRGKTGQGQISTNQGRNLVVRDW